MVAQAKVEYFCIFYIGVSVDNLMSYCQTHNWFATIIKDFNLEQP